MTLDEYAAMTRQVIAETGFDDFLPTACYPVRHEVSTLAGLPADVEPQPAVLKWAAKTVKAGEEFLVAFKSGPAEFTVIRTKGKRRESATFRVIKPHKAKRRT